MGSGYKELVNSIREVVMSSEGKIKESEVKKERVRFLSGNKLIDMVLGGAKGVYGIPAGKFLNIIGDKSSGKTFLANEFIANAHYRYGDKFKWVYDDCESGYSFDSEALYGFDVNDGKIQSQTVEEAFCNISKFANSLKDGECGIYALDSLDALTCDEQDERAEKRIEAFCYGRSYDKGSYNGNKQKYMSQEFFPQLCSKIQNKSVMVIIISQVRENLTPFSFEKFRRNGGKALDFYAHTCLWLANLKKIEKKGRTVGVIVKAKAKKSKTARPFRDCVFPIIFDYGVDNIGACVDYFYDLLTPTGEYSVNCKAISTGKKPTLTELKKFCKDGGVLDDLKGYKTDDLMSFIENQDDLRKKYESEFGKTMNRDELIEYIEENNLIADIEEKAEAKWEEAEDALKSNRKKRVYYFEIARKNERD